jgi:hypothetical protein
VQNLATSCSRQLYVIDCFRTAWNERLITFSWFTAVRAQREHKSTLHTSISKSITCRDSQLGAPQTTFRAALAARGVGTSARLSLEAVDAL